jgi:O-methyltransferase involved in polyketide biosynthesis
MNDISNTALVTLRCHIEDAKQTDSILKDRSSLKTYEYLNTILDEEDKKILNKRVKRNLVKHTALRAKKYDDYVIQFLSKHPEAIIINIGCGLDHRFERIDNGKCEFIDLDLPDVMDIKKNIFPGTKRYRQIGQSVFDFNWLDNIDKAPVLLLAEGVFMFCNETEVKALFNELHKRMPDSCIVFEVFSSKWLKGWKGKATEFKLRKQLKFGKDASFQFGIADSDEIENWSENYKLIEDWSYFDVIKPNVKDFLRKIQWTVYYKIK